MLLPASTTPISSVPRGFLWGAATPPTKSRVLRSQMAPGRASGTDSPTLPGGPRRNETGDIACDHYRLYADDVAIMQDLGLTAYRFSVAWGRVCPEGKGAINPKGIDFYRACRPLARVRDRAGRDPLSLGPPRGSG